MLGPAPVRRYRRRARRFFSFLPASRLHASVRVKASDRIGLERLARYMARPAVPEDRLVWRPDGRVEFRLKRTWRGGVRSLIYEPVSLIARLAALIGPPRTHAQRFFGVFASRHALRSAVTPAPPDPSHVGHPVAPRRPKRMLWADLLQRTSNIDALRCSRCQGRLRVVAAIHDPTAIQAILAAIHLAQPTAVTEPALTAPRGPPGTRSVANMQ